MKASHPLRTSPGLGGKGNLLPQTEVRRQRWFEKKTTLTVKCPQLMKMNIPLRNIDSLFRPHHNQDTFLL